MDVEIQKFIIGIILFLIFSQLLQWAFKRAVFISLIDKIPGPKSYPLIGTTWMFFGAKREGNLEKKQIKTW